MLAEIADPNVVRQLVLDELARGVRQQHLAAVGRGADACASVDAHPDVSLAADDGLTGVDPHAHMNGDAVGPGLRSQGALRRYGGGDRVTGTREGDEESVALRVDLVAVELFNRRAEQPRVRGQDFVVLPAELLKQPRRAFDVAEEESDGAGRTLRHRDGLR